MSYSFGVAEKRTSRSEHDVSDERPSRGPYGLPPHILRQAQDDICFGQDDDGNSMESRAAPTE